MTGSAKEWHRPSHRASLTTGPLTGQAFIYAEWIRASRFSINVRSPNTAITGKQFPRMVSRIAGDQPGATHSIQTRLAT